jgi:hypothetical protein
MEQTYFRRGLGLKKEIEPVLAAEYHSSVVEDIRARGYVAEFGDITIRLAEDFGFCYGVDRAVDYAYQTTHKFPDRRIFLVGEIIHNPHVNRRLLESGVTFLYPDGATGEFDFSGVTADDVVIMPAFGVTMADFQRLKEIGCILIDTTCGSVLNVWKRVESYARDGFTSLIHGKYFHEETRATASQANLDAGGKYIVVRDMDEARLVMDYIEQKPDALSADAFREHFRDKASPGFDPDRTWCGWVWPTRRRCWPRSPWPLPGRGPQPGRALRRREPGGAFPQLRHHLLRHAGAAGRRRPDDAGPAGDHDRDRRLQLVEHQPPGAPVPGVHHGVPHCGCHVYRPGARHHPPQAGPGRGRAGGGGDGLAAGRAAQPGPDGGRVHAEQQDRRDHRADPGHPGQHCPAAGRRDFAAHSSFRKTTYCRRIRR